MNLKQLERLEETKNFIIIKAWFKSWLKEEYYHTIVYDKSRLAHHKVAETSNSTIGLIDSNVLQSFVETGENIIEL